MIMLSKEKVDEMMKLKGNVKGVILKGHFDYIRDLKGEKGIVLVEKRLKELGYPTKAKEIIPTNWYSEALACLIVLVCAEVFNWNQEDVREMAYQSPKYSFIVKLLMQHFVDIEKSFKLAPIYWRKNFDFAKMEVGGFNKKEKYGIIRLVNFHKYHPLICEYHRAYFKKIAEIMLGQRKVEVLHSKCLFRGDDCEEFKITWE
jgi:hypothetical protein